MTKKLRTLPKKFDLSYVLKLPVQERRAATFYEYARHSGPMKALIMQVRKEGCFNGKPASPELKELLIPKMNAGVFHGDELAMLAECDGFPDQPFKVTAKYRKLFGSTTQLFGIRPPCFIPWHAVDALRADWCRKGLNQLEMLEKSNCHVVYLPRENYTVEEIIEMLGERVRNLRPSQAPEPRNPGRKGRTKTMGTLDMVRQLMAYRLDAAGCDFSHGGQLYLSEKGWGKAIRAVKDRIDGMMDRPFFELFPEGKSGTK